MIGNYNPYSLSQSPIIGTLKADEIKIRKFKTICVPIDPNRKTFTIENCINFIPHDNYVTIVRDTKPMEDTYTVLGYPTNSMVNLPLMHYLKIEVKFYEHQEKR